MLNAVDGRRRECRKQLLNDLEEVNSVVGR